MTYTITAYDMDHDEVLYTSEDLVDAKTNYASIIESFKAGKSGFNVEDAGDGITVALEDEDEQVISEQTFNE